MSEEPLLRGDPASVEPGAVAAQPAAMQSESAAAQADKPAAESAHPAAEPPPVLQGEQRPVDPIAADDVLTKQMPGYGGDAAVLRQSRSRTRRSFVVAAAGAAAGFGLYRALGDGPTDEDGNNLLRKTLRLNAAVSRTIFRDAELAPTYPLARAENLRVNGVYGLKKELKTEHWRLQLVGMRHAAQHPRYTADVTAWEYRYSGETTGDMGHDTKVDPVKERGNTDPAVGPAEGKGKDTGTSAQGTAEKMAPAPMLAKAKADENKGDDDDGPDANGTGRKSRGNEEAGESNSTLRSGTPGLLLTLQDAVGQLPRHELVTQFKCIEGWSQVVHWAGVRMADFLELYPPQPIDGHEPRYVYMETPDGDYYTGYDMRTMRHPQTLLVTEMMGAPLTQFHGAPLRLHMPTKYGYKQIKRIGLIAYTDDRPDDYWTKLGYDWYAGL